MKPGYLLASLFAIVAIVTIAACDQTPKEQVQAVDAAHASAMAGDCPMADEEGNITIVPGLTATVIAHGYGRAAVSRDYADVHTRAQDRGAIQRSGRSRKLFVFLFRP